MHTHSYMGIFLVTEREKCRLILENWKPVNFCQMSSESPENVNDLSEERSMLMKNSTVNTLLHNAFLGGSTKKRRLLISEKKRILNVYLMSNRD